LCLDDELVVNVDQIRMFHFVSRPKLFRIEPHVSSGLRAPLRRGGGFCLVVDEFTDFQDTALDDGGLCLTFLFDGIVT
jgi:hypothetical protein